MTVPQHDLKVPAAAASLAIRTRCGRSEGRGHGIRDEVRAATRAVHERLHQHGGLKAVADGTISRPAYRALLGHLYGFHLAVERAAGWSGWRSEALKADLAALGAPPEAIDALPLCARLPDLRTPERRAGALYVVEGSALGGRVLAQAVRPLLGEAEAGRRFFLVGGRPGAWRACLDTMDRMASDAAARRRMIGAAEDTFAAFEVWLAEWVSDHD